MLQERLIRCITKVFSGLMIFVFSAAAIAQPYQPNWESLDSRPVPQWFKDVKFGIFIHWGVYSVPAFSKKGNYAEWYQHALNNGDSATIKYHKERFGNLSYYKFADQFKAELFNPDEWAKLIEQSGAKYVVLTSKHHDGYTLWPYKPADQVWGFPWNSGETGPKRDLLGDLFTALRKTTVHPGIYFSLYEWYNPLWLKDKPRYISEYLWPQMQNVINTYKPEVFWTDGDWELPAETWKSQEFLAWMYNESPVKNTVVTNDRWGSGVRKNHGAVFTPEYEPDLNYEDHYWEESRGMGRSYGYNRMEDAWDYNSTQSLVLQLVDKVSHGGNFLLDIGPDSHGKIPPIMQERLLQIGDWMKINSEAIYNTQRWKVPDQWSEGDKNYKPATGSGDLLLKLTIDPDPGYAVKECFFTYNKNANTLYAILPKYPDNNTFIIKNMQLDAGTNLSFLATKEKLTWKNENGNTVISLPPYDPNKIKAPYAYVIKMENYGKYLPKPKIDVNYGKTMQKPVININAEPGASIHYTTDSSEPTINSALYLQPFTVAKSSLIKAVSFGDKILSSATASEDVAVLQYHKAKRINKLKPGIHYMVYEVNANKVADLQNSIPVKTGVTTTISTQPVTRKEEAGLEFNGFIRIKEDGIYTFYLSSDDGSVLWIDGVEIINNDGLHGSEEKTGQIALKKGVHSIKIAYIQGTGDAVLKLDYSKGNEAKKSVNADMLFYR